MQNDLASKPLDLTGRWRVTHYVEASQRRNFIGMDIGFQITLFQDGEQLGGEGEKFLVDRQPANSDEVSRLAITGWVHDAEVRISLMESSPQGPERTIIGEIVWNALSPDHMIGSFRVDLAETSGRSEAMRQAS